MEDWVYFEDRMNEAFERGDEMLGKRYQNAFIAMKQMQGYHSRLGRLEELVSQLDNLSRRNREQLFRIEDRIRTISRQTEEKAFSEKLQDLAEELRNHDL